MERLKSVRRAIDFRMRKCSNGRIMYYERYTPELLDVDNEDVETFVFDLQDKIRRGGGGASIVPLRLAVVAGQEESQ
jgi:hypothetical protein